MKAEINMNKDKENQKQIMAEHRYARISAEKTRLVARLVKGLSAEEAVAKLTFINKKASTLLLKVLESAIANAEHNWGLVKEKLQVRKIEVGEGPTLKRWRARSRGMANRINKRTSHIKIILEVQNVKEGKKKAEKQEPKKEQKIKSSKSKVKN